MKIPERLRLTTSHVWFCTVYCVISYALYNVMNYATIAKWFRVKDGTDYTGLFAYYGIGLLMYIFVFLLLAHRRSTRFLAILFCALSTTATYFIHKYDVAIDRTMLENALHTDRSEVHSLLSWQMLPYILLLTIVPILVIARTTITFDRRYFLASLRTMLVVLSLSLALAYAKFESIHRAGNLSNKNIVHSLVPINYLQSFGSIVQNALEPYFAARKKSVAITGSVTSRRDLLVVLAVGETARQASFSLYGYRRQITTPELMRIDGLHALNGNARIGSTLYALPEILAKGDVTLPAVTAKLGIDTVCYVNYTLYDNCVVPGEIAASNCGHGGTCYDEDVLPLLDKKLQSRTPGYSFVVLHLGGGSHGPSYQERYPAEFQRFQPMCHDADVVNQCSREQLYNSYDNTILYTDHVVSNIIDRLDQSRQPYVFIYLSDHGESLLEEGRVFHGMPPGIPLPPEQAQIPMLVKSSIPVQIRPQNDYEQRDVFDTVLSLFSVQSVVHDDSKSFLRIVP